MSMATTSHSGASAGHGDRQGPVGFEMVLEASLMRPAHQRHQELRMKQGLAASPGDRTVGAGVSEGLDLGLDPFRDLTRPDGIGMVSGSSQ